MRIMRLTHRSRMFIMAIPLFIFCHLLFTRMFQEEEEDVYFKQYLPNQNLKLESYPLQTGPQKVLILAYQRSGSTFLGFVFNENPDALFLYEPVDGIYSAMYGTNQGWNIPSDIFNYGNSSYRDIPDSEKTAIAEMINNFYNCELRKIPTEVLTHYFTSLFHKQQKSLKTFTTCVRREEKLLNRTSSKCLSYVKRYCPRRFRPESENLRLCKAFMWDVREHMTDYSFNQWQQTLDAFNFSSYNSKISKKKFKINLSKKSLKNLQISFQNYHMCVNKVTTAISHCITDLESQCESSSIRAVKTVRVTMDTAQELLKLSSKMSLIHLMRDPKPVSLSRIKKASYKGATTGLNYEKEAAIYCDRVVRDIKIRNALIKDFHYNIKQVIYEDFVKNPYAHTLDIYESIGKLVPNSMKTYIEKYTMNVKNSTRIAASWMGNMTYLTAKNINYACRDFFKTVQYDWL